MKTLLVVLMWIAAAIIALTAGALFEMAAEGQGINPNDPNNVCTNDCLPAPNLAPIPFQVPQTFTFQLTNVPCCATSNGLYYDTCGYSTDMVNWVRCGQAVATNITQLVVTNIMNGQGYFRIGQQFGP